MGDGVKKGIVSTFIIALFYEKKRRRARGMGSCRRDRAPRARGEKEPAAGAGFIGIPSPIIFFVKFSRAEMRKGFALTPYFNRPNPSPNGINPFRDGFTPCLSELYRFQTKSPDRQEPAAWFFHEQTVSRGDGFSRARAERSSGPFGCVDPRPRPAPAERNLSPHNCGEFLGANSRFLRGKR